MHCVLEEQYRFEKGKIQMLECAFWSLLNKIIKLLPGTVFRFYNFGICVYSGEDKLVLNLLLCCINVAVRLSCHKFNH